MPNGLDLGAIFSQAETIKGQRNVNALNQQQFQANALAQQGGNQFNQLLQQHLANPTPESANALVQANPQQAQQVAQAQGAQTTAQQGQAGLNRVQAQKTIGEMDLIINSKAPKRMALTLFQPEQIAQFEQASGETIEEMDDSEVLALATRIRDKATPSAGAEFIASRPGGGGVSPADRGFDDLISGFSPEDRIKAKRVKAGLLGRASNVKTAMIGDVLHTVDPVTNVATPVTVGGEALTAEVVGREAGIVEGERKRGAARGASAAKAIDKGFNSINKIDGNVRNLTRAIAALDKGAKTGAIQNLLPSIRASSVELDNLQKELAIDVIGAVTFGALSKGELDLAKEKALPTGLNEVELRDWLVRRIAAQNKLRGYLLEQINFLDEGGTIVEFLNQKQQTQGQQQGTGTPTTLETTLPEGLIDNGDGTFTTSAGDIVRRKDG